MCLLCSSAEQISWIGRLEGEKKNFLVPESTSSDKYAIANGASQDENIHKEQSDKGLHCLQFCTEF